MDKIGLWKLAPVVVTKPWGLIHREALELTGIEAGLGELWLASAQTGPRNYSNIVTEPALRKTLARLLSEAAAEGTDALERLVGQPALTHMREHPRRGKTEAWYVRVAEGRTGLAAGPRCREDADRLQDVIETQGLEPNIEAWSEEVRQLFGLVEPLEGGEVFLNPAGTLHTMFAVGPDSRLIIDELQQGYGQSLLPTLSKMLMVQNDILSVQVHPTDETVAATAEGRMQVDQDLQANPTVRVYDFGRRPGEYPELGFRLVDPSAGLRRCAPFAVDIIGGQNSEVIVADTHFVKSRMRLKSGGSYRLDPRFRSYHVLHCLLGAAELRAGDCSMAVRRGETAFVPACLEEELHIEAKDDCEFFDDSFPDMADLTSFLGKHGADADQIEALLTPGRALPSAD